jgi:hypothetical protein
MALSLKATGVEFVSYLDYGSLTLKLNTLDFTVTDAGGADIGAIAAPSLLTPVVLSSPGDFPDWTGYLAGASQADMVNLPTGHYRITVAARNTTSGAAISAPFDLSDAPSAGLFELEDGSGNIVLEDGLGGAYLTEGSSYGYEDLAMGKQLNIDSTLTYLGRCKVYQPGLWPGMDIAITSSNLDFFIGGPATHYTIQTIEVTYPAGPGKPEYVIEFGTAPQVFASWVHAQ